METTIRKSPLLVTAAIITVDNRVLVTRRPADKAQPLLWEFPGGKMEPGESPEQSLRRELSEELAIDVAVEGVFDVIYHQYDWGPVLILAYHCRWLSGEIQHIEVDNHCWASTAELSQLPFLAADLPLINRLRQGETNASKEKAEP